MREEDVQDGKGCQVEVPKGRFGGLLGKSWSVHAPGFLFRLIVVLGLFAGIAFSTVHAGETQKYLGQILSKGNPPGHGSWGGECISTNPVGPNDCLFSLTGRKLVTSNGMIISVIWLKGDTGARDEDGNTIWRAEDALEYPESYQGTFDTESCLASAYPNAKIIAMGRWRWRKPPEFGGYLAPIEKAWRVDFKMRKFVEIPTKGVVCELSENRD